MLGEQAVLGKRAWDQQGSLTLLLGPLDKERFKTFLPTGSCFPALRDLVRFYVGPTLSFEIVLSLQADTIAGACLAADDRADRLGWTTWLSGKSGSGDLRVRLNPDSRHTNAK